MAIQKKTITIHKGWFFRNVTMGVMQTVITHNIAKELDLEALEAAVFRLVDRNPILSGTLFLGGSDNPGVFVETGQFDKFVYKLQTPKDIPSPAGLSSAELTKYCQTYLEPLIPPSLKGVDELKQKTQLFAIHVMELPDGYIYYAPRQSHVVGDGVTYYNVLQELNAILASLTNKNEDGEAASKLPPPIVWESPVGIHFDFSHQISNPLLFISMICMILVYAICGLPKTEHILLQKDKIEAKKKELCAASTKYLSTNDIVVAALCQAGCSKRYQYFNQSVDFRKRLQDPNCGERDGGNITRLVPFYTKPAEDPNNVRSVTGSLNQQPNIDIPFWPTVRGSGYNHTNWACIQQTLGDSTIFHTPFQAVVDVNDVPIVIIYQPNDKEIGIIHKLGSLDTKNGLMGELVVATK